MIRPWTSFIRDPKLQPAGTSTTLDLALPATFGYPSRTYATGTRESLCREMLAFDWTETAFISLFPTGLPSAQTHTSTPYVIVPGRV
ncbi:hypothetical protein PGT21_025459 [Puccinia graminis f. sp. tritici]|uniref:Uncharacterized protein n=1 Tax=Puccinia graminis f. sp. tritici TaxID=56615 RepID=A0A5B0N597_PUCGR|nr:hypothetical protein PGT21_025459 [Puccinia graminis f. sp. tritici]KAA1092255.1 hypothetical protein PGTUg99_007612 [Puccinia graminis f. sp. tritici]